MKKSLMFLVFPLVLALPLACTSEEEDPCDGKPEVTNAVGLLSGYECTTDDDCMYGQCNLDPVTTGGAFGICTRDCPACPGSECSADDVSSEGLSFTCIFATGVEKHCVPECSSLDDCLTISDKYTACSLTPPDFAGGSIGAQKFCTMQ